MSQAPQNFKPALLVVDVQEDFCPPVCTPTYSRFARILIWPQNGSLAVPNGRAIVPTVNELLSLPFAIKVATRDWHSRDHISFASNHAGPDNIAYVSKTIIIHPFDPARTYETLLWPPHCIEDTPGAQLLPELHRNRIDMIIDKGKDPRLEMYSSFTDPFHEAPFTSDSTSVSTSELPRLLQEKGITHVYIVGLAQDYCVRASAIDSARFGYTTFVVKEGTMAVDPVEGWKEAEKSMLEAGVRIIGMEGMEVAWVREMLRT